MPAITKETAIEILRCFARDVQQGHSLFSSQAREALRATEHITEAAATQAAGDVPPFIVQAAEKAIHAANNPTGMHTNGPTIAHIEVSRLSALLRYATANPAPTAPATAPTDLSAVEVPPLNSRQQFEIYASNMGLRDFEISSDDADNYRNPGMQGPWNFWRAGRASMKGNE